MKLSQKPSKIWIYGPLYMLLLFVVCVGTWHIVKPDKSNLQSTISETVALETGIVPGCFKQYCANRSPIFQLWPDKEILKALEADDDDCVNSICSLCMESARFSKDQPFAEKDCLSSLFEAARRYHFAQLKILPKMFLFFDSGEAELSEEQSSDLNAFLKAYRGLEAGKGVLIIGRASQGGSNVDNERLSSERSRNIQIMLGKLLGEDFKRDYVYFGAKPPQLTMDDVHALNIDPESYHNVKVTGQPLPDYSLRLNQSVIVVVYDLGEGVFGKL